MDRVRKGGPYAGVSFGHFRVPATIKGGRDIWFEPSSHPPPHTSSTPNGSVNLSRLLQPLRHPSLHKQQRPRPFPTTRKTFQISTPDPRFREPVRAGHSCSHAEPEAVIIQPQHHPLSRAQTTHRFGESSAVVYLYQPAIPKTDLHPLPTRPILSRVGGDPLEEKADSSTGSCRPRSRRKAWRVSILLNSTRPVALHHPLHVKCSLSLQVP